MPSPTSPAIWPHPSPSSAMFSGHHHLHLWRASIY
ncbi:hypothetical protein OROGR_030550 [Orobanche gracilis]